MFADLVDLSRQQVAADISGLGENEGRLLADSLVTVRRLLDVADQTGQEPTRLRGPRAGDYGWIIQSQAEAYTRDYGWNDAFEAVVAGVVADYLKNYDPARERTWIAELGDRRVGSVVLADGGNGVAKLRLLYVDPVARGRGLGKAMVEEVIAFARTCDYRRISLWTNDILTAALHIYIESGFQRVEETTHTMFGPEMKGQTWVLDLQSDRSAGA